MRLLDRGRLLVGQAGVGATGGDRLGVDARAGPGVEARQDPAVARRIEQRQREALVAAGLLERVVADETDPLERLRWVRFEDRRPGGQRRRARARPRRPRRGARRGPPRGSGRRRRGSDRAAGRRAGASVGRARRRPARSRTTTTMRPTMMRSEIGLDERVEVDPRVLRWWAGPSLAGRPHRGRIGRGAILCRRQTPGLRASRDRTTVHPLEAPRRPWPSESAAARPDPDSAHPCSAGRSTRGPDHGQPDGRRARAPARRPDRRGGGARRRARGGDRGRGAPGRDDQGAGTGARARSRPPPRRRA